ncbi:hypothetical protein M3Y95_00271200 [Aphelenchoides besseyi]|nr:hypothetical protein M3Y95_00271200 [Aphelenchoides besseyi]
MFRLLLSILGICLIINSVKGLLCYKENRGVGDLYTVVCAPSTGLCANYQYGDGTISKDCNVGDCRGEGVFTTPAYRVYCCSGNKCNGSSRIFPAFVFVCTILVSVVKLVV